MVSKAEADGLVWGAGRIYPHSQVGRQQLWRVMLAEGYGLQENEEEVSCRCCFSFPSGAGSKVIWWEGRWERRCWKLEEREGKGSFSRLRDIVSMRYSLSYEKVQIFH